MNLKKMTIQKGDIEKKIDVYQQVMMNIDIVAKLLMEEINGTKS